MKSEIEAELQRRRFGKWLPAVSPSLRWDWAYSIHIRQYLARVTSGEIDRLMIFLHPRIGKSELMTVRYPVWRLERNPELKIIIGAYNQTLANKFSRKARRIAAERLTLASDRQAVDDWETAGGGGLRAVGVGGGITGQGGDCFAYETKVFTEIGEISIGRLYQLQYRPRVLVFNHKLNRLEYKNIVAMRERLSSEINEVITRTGRRFKCTRDHLVYTDKRGYRAASLLCSGDELKAISNGLPIMREEKIQIEQNVRYLLPESAGQKSNPDLLLLPDRISKTGLYSRKGYPKERDKRHLLLPEMFTSASCGKKCERLRLVQKTEARQAAQQILFDEVSDSITASIGNALSMVREGDQKGQQENILLFCQLRQCRPFRQDEGQKKSSLQDRDQLREMVCRNATIDNEAGQFSMCCVPSEGTEEGNFLEGAGCRQDQLVHTSYQWDDTGQQEREFGHALRKMPSEIPQIERDHVALVRPIRNRGINVYDLQVEGCHNFFAEGILVHNCILIDDPVKNREEANSQTYRDKVWDWFTDDLYTRLEPGGAIILTMTRWHEDDLAGRILESEEADQWTVVRIPALAETQQERDEYHQKIGLPQGLPDPLDRLPGQATCPDRYDETALDRIRGVLGNSFYALYQQRPTAPEGDMFKREWFKVVDSVPPDCRRVRYWDKAGTAGGGAFTCGVLIARDGQGRFFVDDIVRGQWSAGDREKVIRQTAELDGPGVAIWVEQEPGSGGKESAENTIRNLAGFNVQADRVTGDKVTRAEPFAAQCQGGNVYLRRAAWNRGYLDRVTVFPGGTFADDVDASSGAFNKLAPVGRGGEAKSGGEQQRSRWKIDSDHRPGRRTGSRWKV